MTEKIKYVMLKHSQKGREAMPEKPEKSLEIGTIVALKRFNADLVCVVSGVRGERLVLRLFDSHRSIEANAKSVIVLSPKQERLTSDLLSGVDRQREVVINRRKSGKRNR